MKLFFRSLLVLSLLLQLATTVMAASPLTEKGYTLEKILIMSRHNMRAPIGDAEKYVAEYTNHQWQKFPVSPGDLTLRGAASANILGSYYNLYLTDEGLFTPNHQPAADEVRFYANSFQRTIASAHHFAAGMLPTATTSIEYHNEINTDDPVFVPPRKCDDPELSRQIMSYYDRMWDGLSFAQSARQTLSPQLRGLETVLDFSRSPFAEKNSLRYINPDSFTFTTENGLPSFSNEREIYFTPAAA